jgi:hypothetical protein
MRRNTTDRVPVRTDKEKRKGADALVHGELLTEGEVLEGKPAGVLAEDSSEANAGRSWS